MMPLAEPQIRISELNENSTRWDGMRAAPSDSLLRNMWIGWSSVFFISSFFNLVVFLAIVLTKRVRNLPFNMYLVALMLPDLIYTGFCAFQCATLAALGGYQKDQACLFQSVYVVFGVAGNSWLNGAIAYEIYQLLIHCRDRRRYYPPSKKRVLLITGGCYAWSIFVASSALWIKGVSVGVANGLVCVPLAFDIRSELLFWLVFFPLMNGIPMTYSFYVAFKTHQCKLLPPSGKTRDLTVTFLRIVVCFAVVWLPSIFFVFANPAFFGIGFIYAAGTWAHMQGGLSALILLFKSDFQSAFLDFVTCHTWNANRDYDQRASSQQTTSSWVLAPQNSGFLETGQSRDFGSTDIFRSRSRRRSSRIEVQAACKATGRPHDCRGFENLVASQGIVPLEEISPEGLSKTVDVEAAALGSCDQQTVSLREMNSPNASNEIHSVEEKDEEEVKSGSATFGNKNLQSGSPRDSPIAAPGSVTVDETDGEEAKTETGDIESATLGNANMQADSPHGNREVENPISEQQVVSVDTDRERTNSEDIESTTSTSGNNNLLTDRPLDGREIDDGLIAAHNVDSKELTDREDVPQNTDLS